MRTRSLALAALLGLAAGGTTMAAAPAVTGTTTVTIRVYNASGIDTAAVRAALTAAEPSLASAGVDVAWVICQGTACATPLGTGELTVRMVRTRAGVRPRERFRGQGGTLPLGDALIDPRAGGVLATVYVDRVEWLAGTAGASVSSLLGRAMAHEIGHLLLASRVHSKYGLMRAVWSRDEVSRGSGAEWSFTSEDARAIQSRRAASEDGNIVWGTE